MTNEFLNIIAVSAFAFSGAIVALSERYDIFGTFILGIATSFAGGIIRNIALDVPVVHVWEQGYLFYVALITIAIVYVFPKNWVLFWNRWNIYSDAVGLSAFAIQGAAFAAAQGFSLGGIVFSAILTGVGGGVTRDVLAQRRPMVLHQEIYAVWALAVGLAVGFEIVNLESIVEIYLLFVVIIGCRVLSYHLGWHLRFRDLYRL
ncbi:trimeric intracellular cation channel family protein [Halobacillus massiliensis]|uniref:trimeric intracellular cation channel family protein n=1 Tax=Halobacillus massiliensis TaxID=1926286 RepID=UPI0009E43C39|nr:trimeric intracellular cation channel family protein [Halobacillus massiliensis]